MPESWNGTLSTGRSEPLTLPGLAWPVELRPHPRARAMRLRLDEARQRLVLSFPKRASRKAALDWAARQGIKPNAAWLAEHPGWTSENEAKECAADRAYIKQRWGY